MLALINALPSPVTLPCFLQALARPLKMHASVSLISAQPSAGARSPRIFLFFDGMRMSIVPAGAGAPLLELGEIREESRSLKAEILFPVTTPLDAATPYQRILFTPTVTRCGFCHPVETPDPDITFATAFTSVALRPLDSYAVTIDSLANELAICDPSAEPDRCAMLQALFDQGPPVEQPLSRRSADDPVAAARLAPPDLFAGGAAGDRYHAPSQWVDRGGFVDERNERSRFSMVVLV